MWLEAPLGHGLASIVHYYLLQVTVREVGGGKEQATVFVRQVRL